MIKNILVLLLILIPCISNSQSLEDVNKQATSMGVTTQSDVLKELAKRGMTEADARRMAAVYGLDYDEYIAKYITNKTQSTTTTPSMLISPAVSELTIIGDTIDFMIPPTEDNTLDEIRYWMEMNEIIVRLILKKI